MEWILQKTSQLSRLLFGAIAVPSRARVSMALLESSKTKAKSDAGSQNAGLCGSNMSKDGVPASTTTDNDIIAWRSVPRSPDEVGGDRLPMQVRSSMCIRTCWGLQCGSGENVVTKGNWQQVAILTHMELFAAELVANLQRDTTTRIWHSCWLGGHSDVPITSPSGATEASTAFRTSSSHHPFMLVKGDPNGRQLEAAKQGIADCSVKCLANRDADALFPKCLGWRALAPRDVFRNRYRQGHAHATLILIPGLTTIAERPGAAWPRKQGLVSIIDFLLFPIARPPLGDSFDFNPSHSRTHRVILLSSLRRGISPTLPVSCSYRHC
jgi:hypothetical protein